MTGKDIRRIRKKLAMNQTQFAQLLGVHQITVSNWERDVSEPTPYQVSMIADFGKAAKKNDQIGKVALGTMIGAGIGFAVYKLLEATYGKRKQDEDEYDDEDEYEDDDELDDEHDD